MDENESKCEGCGCPYSLDKDDYCAKCGKNLCLACMKKGCCGQQPAKSGLEQDHSGEGDEEKLPVQLPR